MSSSTSDVQTLPTTSVARVDWFIRDAGGGTVHRPVNTAAATEDESTA